MAAVNILRDIIVTKALMTNARDGHSENIRKLLKTGSLDDPIDGVGGNGLPITPEKEEEPDDDLHVTPPVNDMMIKSPPRRTTQTASQFLPDINETDNWGRTPLFLATMGGHVQAVKTILSISQENKNRREIDETLKKDCEKKKQHLYKEVVDFRRRDQYGRTILFASSVCQRRLDEYSDSDKCSDEDSDDSSSGASCDDEPQASNQDVSDKDPPNGGNGGENDENDNDKNDETEKSGTVETNNNPKNQKALRRKARKEAKRLAACGPSTECVKLILDALASRNATCGALNNKFNRCGNGGNPISHRAVLASFHALISLHGILNHRDKKDKRTLLVSAVSNSQIELVQMLLSYHHHPPHFGKLINNTNDNNKEENHDDNNNASLTLNNEENHQISCGGGDDVDDNPSALVAAVENIPPLRILKGAPLYAAVTSRRSEESVRLLIESGQKQLEHYSQWKKKQHAIGNDENSNTLLRRDENDKSGGDGGGGDIDVSPSMASFLAKSIPIHALRDRTARHKMRKKMKTIGASLQSEYDSLDASYWGLTLPARTMVHQHYLKIRRPEMVRKALRREFAIVLPPKTINKNKPCDGSVNIEMEDVNLIGQLDNDDEPPHADSRPRVMHARPGYRIPLHSAALNGDVKLCEIMMDAMAKNQRLKDKALPPMLTGDGFLIPVMQVAESVAAIKNLLGKSPDRMPPKPKPSDQTDDGEGRQRRRDPFDSSISASSTSDDDNSDSDNESIAVEQQTTHSIAKHLMQHALHPDGLDVDYDVLMNPLALFTSAQRISFLFQMAAVGDLEMVKLLISAGADVNTFNVVGAGLNDTHVLHYAALKGHAGVVEYLVNLTVDAQSQCPFSYNSDEAQSMKKDYSESSASSSSSSSSSDSGSVMGGRSGPSSDDDNGEKEDGREDVAEAEGSSLSSSESPFTSSDDEPPHACTRKMFHRRGHHSMFTTLQQRDDEPDGKKRAKDFVFRVPNIDVRDEDGNTPLLLAVEKGHIEVVRVLLGVEAGGGAASTDFSHDTENDQLRRRKSYADPNFGVDSYGGVTTCLSSACEEGHYEIAKLLVRAGADIVKAVFAGGIDSNVTPLIHAVSGRRKSLRIARLLMRGADDDGCGSAGLAAHIRSLFSSLEKRSSENAANTTILDDGDGESDGSAAIPSEWSATHPLYKALNVICYNGVDKVQLKNESTPSELAEDGNTLSILKEIFISIGDAKVVTQIVNTVSQQGTLLMTAALAGNSEIIAFFLTTLPTLFGAVAVQPDVTVSNWVGQTVIWHAASVHSTFNVERNVEAGVCIRLIGKYLQYLRETCGEECYTSAASIINKPTVGGGLAPIHIAAQNGNQFAIAALADIGADMNLPTGELPKAEGPESEAANNPVENEENDGDGFGLVPLMLAGNHLEAAKALIAGGANVDGIHVGQKSHPSTVLGYHTINSNVSMIQILLDNGADVEFSGIRTGNGPTPLHTACREGITDAIRALVLQGNANINALDDVGLTPLHHAVASSDISPASSADAVKFLLDHGAKADSISYEYATTPLHVACQVSASEALSLLIEHIKGAEEKQHEIEERKGSNDSDGCAVASDPPLFAYPRLTKLLSLRCSGGMTPLNLAAHSGFTEGISIIASLAKISPNIVNFDAIDDSGKTPLQTSIAQGHFETAQCLVAIGATVDYESSIQLGKKTKPVA